MKQVKTLVIKKLRLQTRASISEIRRALEEASGDPDKAKEILRKSGSLKASQKADRLTGQGVIEAYIHGEGRLGVLVEVNCETDFVAKTSEFKSLVHDLALHIAASAPLYLSREEASPSAAASDCLLEQPFVKNPEIRVRELINQKIAILGENIRIKRFVRWMLGQEI